MRPTRELPVDLTGRTVVFLHAHPDDEAIFTGATMRRLADRGARVVLVTATGGEEGVPLVPLPRGRALARVRLGELERACDELGVARLVLLRYRDSGMAGTTANARRRAFSRDPARAVPRLVDLLETEGAEALVHYDERGIYGHPDHVAVHRLGRAAARVAGVVGYQATVDPDGLPQRGRHLVEGDRPRALRSLLGTPARRITTVLDADAPEVEAKRLAMAAHPSQIAAEVLVAPGFHQTYAREWYVRDGAPGLLDLLTRDQQGPPGVAAAELLTG